MSFGLKGTENIEYPQALPVTSVDTLEDAEALVIRTCKRSYDDSRYLINGESGFRHGNYHTIERVGHYLERNYEEMR